MPESNIDPIKWLKETPTIPKKTSYLSLHQRTLKQWAIDNNFGNIKKNITKKFLSDNKHANKNAFFETVDAEKNKKSIEDQKVKRKAKYQKQKSESESLKFSYEHSIKKIVEHYKFSFINNMSYDDAIHNYHEQFINRTLLETLKTQLPKSMNILKLNIQLHQQLIKLFTDATPAKIGIVAKMLYYGDSPDENVYANKVIQKLSNFRRVLEADDFNSIIDDMIHEINDKIALTDSRILLG